MHHNALITSANQISPQSPIGSRTRQVDSASKTRRENLQNRNQKERDSPASVNSGRHAPQQDSAPRGYRSKSTAHRPESGVESHHARKHRAGEGTERLTINKEAKAAGNEEIQKEPA